LSILALVLWVVPDSQLALAQGDVVSYRLLCDASAAVLLDPNHFIVANDERNQLRVYARGSANPVGSIDLAPFLDTASDKESDLEGAAVVGDRVYWISSHGRNQGGKIQERRYRFFATAIRPETAPPQVEPLGQAYSGLLDDLIAAPQLANYKLADAAQLAPEKPGGLNIEGLAAGPNGTLLIGFRNPLPGGNALVVPIVNPAELVGNGEEATAQFGVPLELDLNARGIRSLEFTDPGYAIVAGPFDDAGAFGLYRWSGNETDVPAERTDVDFGELRPEALFPIPGTANLQVLSDDGSVMVGTQECKRQPEDAQSFRSIIVTR
jgi:hypothetical protein